MELNIQLQFCPKKEPNYKGTVERFQGHLNRSVCHRIPGTTFSNISQRGEYHSEKMAKITLNELKKLIHEWIIEIYNHEINRTTQRIPYAIWCDGINIREPLLPESIQQLDLIFTKEYTRKLNHEGILLYGLHYNSAELAILRKRYYQSYDVKVRFDPANIQSVWVYDDVNGDYINVRCTEIDYSTELSLKEHLLIRSMKWKQGKSEQDSLSLMKSKEEFTEHLHELSNSKKIRPRQQAARHTLHKKDKREEPFKTNELERKYTLQKVEWNLDKIPKFQTSQREDL
jgi:putative transposase